MKKVYYSWSEVNGSVLELARIINNSKWRPDYIVGLTRGGLIPAVMLSQYLEIPMYSLHVSLRDTTQNSESNLWMAEDAFGYNVDAQKNILIVDDINDTGATINWIKRDWQSSCMPDDPKWSSIWHNNVKFAVLTDNLDSDEDVDYSARLFSRETDGNLWFVYPWENFWR